MGFSDHTIHNVSLIPDNYMNLRSKDEKDGKDEDSKENESEKLSDQEILESTEAIYFTSNVDTGIYELKVGQFGVSVYYSSRNKTNFETFRN